MAKAELKLYYDSNCTNELNKENGNYILKMKDILSMLSDLPVIEIYVKNVGEKDTYMFSYNAYISGLQDGVTINCVGESNSLDVFPVGIVRKFKIFITRNTINSKGDKYLTINVNFDDIAKITTNQESYNTVNKIAKRTCEELENINMSELEKSYHNFITKGSFKVGSPEKIYEIIIEQ